MNQKLKFIIALFLIALAVTISHRDIVEGAIVSILLSAATYIAIDTFYRWPAEGGKQ